MKEAIPYIISAAGFVAVSVLGILGWFLRRWVSSNDRAIQGQAVEIQSLREALEEQKEKDNDKREELRKDYEEKHEKLRDAYDARLREFQTNIGNRFDYVQQEQLRNKSASHHDIDLSSEKLRNDLSALREKLEQHLREFATFKGEIRATYVSREDFIRDSTILESRIVATRRTLEGIDDVLKGFLKE
jgi:hypothetical protein